MNYAKAFVAVITTIISAVVVALTGDSIIDAVEWINVAIAGVGALQVFAAPNVPGARITKTVMAVFSAVLILATSLITDGFTTSEILQLLIAAAGAIGVYAIPNSGGNRVITDATA